MNENMNLNDLMGGKQRHGSTTFDLTSGKAVKVDGNTTTPVVTNVNEAPAPAPKPQQMKAVQTGPVDVNNLRSVDIDSILPKRQPEVDPVSSQIMTDLDLAIERECNNITEFHKELAAKQEEEILAAEEAKEDAELAAADNFAVTGEAAKEEDFSYGLYDDDDTSSYTDNKSTPNAEPATTNRTSYTPTVELPEEETVTVVVDHNTGKTVNLINGEYITEINSDPIVKDPTPVVKEEVIEEVKNPELNMNTNKPVNILDNISDDELYDDDTEEAKPVDPDAPSTEEMINDLKDQIRSRFDTKKIDLSKFTIAKKAISAQKVMKLAVEQHMNSADWVLPSAGRAISMTGLSGPEILKLNPDNSNRNRQNTFRDMYHIMYDHIIDANKPDFETWLKQTRFVDLQHIYFTLYMATFGGSNFINYSCDKCKKVFIKDVTFEDMIVYADDETKKKVAAMLKQDTTTKKNDSYEVELVQVSNNYVLGIRTPSIWNVIMETASLSDQFLEKHSDLIDMVAYIDTAYVIDINNNELIPVDTKPVPNDMAKTAGRRIKAMYDIISSLSSEEFYALRSKINEYDEFASTKIRYKIPGTTCPHCANQIPDNEDVAPDTMLFTRHQLAAIGNM